MLITLIVVTNNPKLNVNIPKLNPAAKEKVNNTLIVIVLTNYFTL